MTASRDAQGQAAAPWHSMSPEAALAAMGSRGTGLAHAEVDAARARHGLNELPPGLRRSLWARLLAQFDNVLIYVLLASAAVTALLGHMVDTAVIVGVVIANAVIGLVQEGKAEAALDEIRGMISPRASVLRAGVRQSIDAADVVPGDILLLEAGDRVGADVRLVRARNLSIDEAVLTGESVPVVKQTEPVAADAVPGDRASMAFSGTLVRGGQGAGVVVATGPATELGRISALLARVEVLETPLVRQMNAFSQRLTWVILALSAATLAFAVLVRGYPTADALLAVVGMAVAAIPEGLPAVMTIALAIGVERMAARNAIIRRLPAVETLGSVSTIATDKTGTLTRNEMTVRTVVLREATYHVAGAGYAPRGGFAAEGREVDPAGEPRIGALAQIAILCNDARLVARGGDFTVEGDPMEGALLAFGAKAGEDGVRLEAEARRLDAIPFDAAHRYMATLNRRHDGAVAAHVKGAPERIVEMCGAEARASGEAEIDRAFWLAAVERLAAGGQRVLALARRPLPAETRTLTFGDVDQGLVLVGLVGLIDPPRPEAITAIADCRAAGIDVKMITGDHAATAAAIARELGLAAPGRVLTGRDLDRLDAAGLREAAATTSVFARTSPEHKLRLVEALQASGAVIAMTGDGVNDAPALKRADVGVAMGRSGTEAAKEASEMVLADDNFASIVAAVREGRTVYDNLTKVIGWTLPTNGGETLIVVAAILAGLTLPMTAAQILWINMVSAVGLGLVLAFEPAEEGVMARPPRRPGAPILSRLLLWRVVLVSVLFATVALALFAWARGRGASEAEARTLVVNAVVVMEIVYLFSVRYRHGTSLTWQGVLGTPAVLIGVGGVVLCQLAFTYLPALQRLFDTRPVALWDGAVVLAVGAALLVVLEAEKWVMARWPGLTAAEQTASDRTERRD